MSSSEDSLTPPASATLRRARPARLATLLGLSFAAVLIAALGIAAWVGYAAGLDQRDQQARATQSAELQHQFQLGIADLEAKRYSVAIDRFRYVLERDAQFPGAAERLLQAQAALDVPATALAPTAAPVVTARGENPAEILALAEQYAAVKDWSGVIAQIALLHTVDPQYEIVRSDALLFTALRERGIARINGEAMEAGIFDLDQAAAFSPLDETARSFRAWARLYLAGKSYWGVNWAVAADILGQLYILAPNFKDTTPLVYEARVNYAQQLALGGDACGAAEQYALALQVSEDATVAEALAAQQGLCAQATPTPEPSPTP